MRAVFMGTPAFAVPSLEALARHHEVVLVITRPDRPAGRGGLLPSSEVKQAATTLGLPVLQPETLRGPATARIAELAPDVVCVAAFGMLLPPETLAVPPLGCINVHASLLPRHRGAAPVQRAILEGDAVTGISIMRMEEGLDTGPYALQRSVPVDALYATELEETLASLGAEALLDTLALMERETVRWVEQDDARATYAPKVTKDDLALTADLAAAEAFARIRAATRRAPARACIADVDLTVVRATPTASAGPAGSVCLIGGVPVLGFADGGLRLDVVRPAGRSDMDGASWARGARLSPEARWTCTR